MGVDSISLERKRREFSRIWISKYTQKRAAEIEVIEPNRIAKIDNCRVGNIFLPIWELTFSPDYDFPKSKKKRDFIESRNDLE